MKIQHRENLKLRIISVQFTSQTIGLFKKIPDGTPKSHRQHRSPSLLCLESETLHRMLDRVCLLFIAVSQTKVKFCILYTA